MASSRKVREQKTPGSYGGAKRRLRRGRGSGKKWNGERVSEGQGEGKEGKEGGKNFNLQTVGANKDL